MSSEQGPDVRGRETGRAAMVSVLSNSLLTGAKLTVGLLTGSVSVISEALHSGNDLVAALLALFSVRKASQPADRRHAFGHGKFEALSGAIEAALIVVAALAIIATAIRDMLLGQGHELEHGPAIAVMGVSALANIVVSAHLRHVANRHESIALHADAAHLTADVWTSAGVFVGLSVAYGFDQAGRAVHWVDPALAILVGLLVMGQGWRIASQSLAQLVDRALPTEEIARIEAIISAHSGMFVEYHELRTRQAGHERHIDLHLVVCRDVPVSTAHALTDHIEQDIRSAFPSAQVMIHVEPCLDGACPEDCPESSAPPAPSAR